MFHSKRWLAALLALTISLSDCGAMTVFATEDAISSASENNVEISEKTTSDEGNGNDNDAISLDASGNTENTETDSLTDTAAELPALHIGQIKMGEALPDPDDLEFSYDQPISFETSDCLLLFINYNIDTAFETEKGTLDWSILRGEKGSEPGSASLLDEEDDWTDFETVSASPFFVMEEITDEESEYYQMMSLTPAETSSGVDHNYDYETGEEPEKYDYYIRAAYYPETENEKDEAFYAAATIPFLPQNTDTEKISDDTEAIEDTQSESISDNTTSVEDTAQEEILEEGTVDAASDDMDADDTDSLEDDGDPEQTPESVSENSAATEPLSDPSENEDEGEAVSQPTENIVGVLTLSAESVTLHTGDTVSVSAAVVPKSITDPIVWKSADETIATVAPVVDENDKTNVQITAAEKGGTTQITATCGTLTASIEVNVIEADENEVYDLSGDIWIDGFQKENTELVYTGQKITQDFKVYHKETLLKEKTDYTLTYKNNVNAAEWNSAKAPNVTITMKGQYQGSATLYYTIYPKDIKGLDIYNYNPPKDNADENDDGETASSGYKQTVNDSTNLKFPTPELILGKKKLAVNKDFVCDYTPLLDQSLYGDYKKGSSYDPWETYYYNVNGKGNFKGTICIPFVVVNNTQNFSSATVKLSAKQYTYQGTELTRSDVEIEKLTLNRKIVDPKYYSYDVYATGIDGAYIMVYPTPAGETAGYRGFKKVALKLVGDRKISDAALGNDWKDEITFSQKTVNESGGIFQNETGELLTFAEGGANEALTEGRDYTVKYTNAKKVGKVTATFTGKGRYKGTFKKQYKIVPNINKNNFTIRWKNVTKENGALTIAYQKGGAVPDFLLLDQDNNVLKNKTDYAVKLTDNKAPGNMTCEITGKGNYKGYAETVQITVKKGDFRQCTLSVPDKAYSTKANAWKSKVTVKDVNGKTLAAGTDYGDVTYSYAGMENEQYPAPGAIVTVKVTGINFYAADTDADPDSSSLTGSYRIFQNNISKLQIVIDKQEYTGKEITLSPKDIHVYANAKDKKAKKELEDATSCYEIVEYKNNIKAGTAKVTLRGIGEYGGAKTYSFKIQKKAYLTNRVKSITLDKKNLNISLAEKGKRTLTATITPKDTSQELTNPTVIWTTSNSNIATIKAIEPVEPAADDKPNTNNVITVKAEITVYKTGTVTITAIAQDGNKKAPCTVKISVPALKEKGQTIRGKTGDTHQLSFIKDGNYEIDMKVFTFESTNSSVASVDSQGLITMKRFGMATIRVYVGNRQSVQQCSLIVEKVSDDELKDSKVLTYTQKAGCKDDTAAINDLLRQAERSGGAYDTVYIPAGTYHINTVGGGFGGLVLTDNQNLIMSPNAKLVALPNSSPNYQVIWAFGRSNVFISGGKIEGDRAKHTGGGEWGHGIRISGCKNVYISNVEVSNCWGDGIYLGFYDGPNVCSNGVTIENCNLHHNRRNNLSITDASNVTVRKCQFNNAGGTDPQYGIDIEPNAGRTCNNVTISDCTFKGNAKGTIQILGQLNAHVKGVTIENCTGDKAPHIESGFGGSVSGVTERGNTWP